MNQFEMACDLWARFLAAFIKRVEVASDEILKEGWETKTRRTELYAKNLIEGVAHDLELEFKSEFFKIDYALRNSDGVPIVLI